MPTIRRTLIDPYGEQIGEPAVFHLAKLNSRVVGAGVNNKVIYDLKKGRRTEVEYSDGSKMVFEVVDLNPEMKQVDAKP